jgi:transcription elongation factor GreB
LVGVRYRPPAEPSSNLLTRGGYDRLKAELDQLWRVRRPEVVIALAAAAAEGDRSENAEYTARKKELGGIDRRVRYLTRRLAEVRVVEQVPGNRDAVFFGAAVELEFNGDEVRWHRIVGPDEVEFHPRNISVDSPLARALLKKELDEEVEFEAPGGRQSVAILAIRYDNDGS